jgi:hypothetical protein
MLLSNTQNAQDLISVSRNTCHFFAKLQVFEEPKIKNTDLIKLELSLYSLDRPRGLQEVQAPRIFRQSAHKNSNVVSHKHRLPLSQRNIPGNRFC